MNNIYMDYNATSPARQEALDAYLRAERDAFANAGSAHTEGRRARRVIDTARERMATLLGVGPDEVIFTSGGTESDNAAIAGVAARRGSGHIVTTAIEHPAVLKSCQSLEKRGFRVTYVAPDTGGTVAPDDVGAAIGDDTILVSVMWVNNETGVIQPIDAIARLARERAVPCHTDAVQAFGRVPVDLSSTPVSLMALSGHKFGAPKGIGVLVVRKPVTIEPLIRGGGQEWNLRSGTLNVAGAAAMVAAAELAHNEAEAERDRLTRLRDRLESGLREKVTGVRINGEGGRRVANTTNAIFRGADGEAVLMGLDEKGIAASSASACAASHSEPSHVLTTMGLSRREAEQSMRFSLGRFSTEGDVDNLLDVLPGIINRIRSLVSH